MNKEKYIKKWRDVIQYGDVKEISNELNISPHLTNKALQGKGSIKIKKNLNKIYEKYFKDR